MNTPFRDALAYKPIPGTLEPKQTSKATHEPNFGYKIMLQKQLSPYENFQQFCPELDFLLCTRGQSTFRPRGRENNEWTLHSEYYAPKATLTI